MNWRYAPCRSCGLSPASARTSLTASRMRWDTSRSAGMTMCAGVAVTPSPPAPARMHPLNPPDLRVGAGRQHEHTVERVSRVTLALPFMDQRVRRTAGGYKRGGGDIGSSPPEQSVDEQLRSPRAPRTDAVGRLVQVRR